MRRVHTLLNQVSPGTEDGDHTPCLKTEGRGEVPQTLIPKTFASRPGRLGREVIARRISVAV
jgi:hypothetical protein